MELPDLCDRGERLQPKSGPNSWFGSSGDEELDTGYLVHVAGEYRQDGRCGLSVLALVKGIDDDEGRYMGGFERTNDELLHLRTEGFLSGVGALLQDLEQLLSERRILTGELEGECWKDHLKIAAVLEVS